MISKCYLPPPEPELPSSMKNVVEREFVQTSKSNDCKWEHRIREASGEKSKVTYTHEKCANGTRGRLLADRTRIYGHNSICMHDNCYKNKQGAYGKSIYCASHSRMYEPNSKPEPKTKSEPKSEPKTKLKLIPEPKSEPRPKMKSKPKTPTKPKTQVKTKRSKSPDTSNTPNTPNTPDVYMNISQASLALILSVSDEDKQPKMITESETASETVGEPSSVETDFELYKCISKVELVIPAQYETKIACISILSTD